MSALRQPARYTNPNRRESSQAVGAGGQSKRGINRGPSHIKKAPKASGVQGASRSTGMDRWYAMNPHASPGDGGYNQERAEAQSAYRKQLRLDKRKRDAAQAAGQNSEEAALTAGTDKGITPEGNAKRGEARWDSAVEKADGANKDRGLVVGDRGMVDPKGNMTPNTGDTVGGGGAMDAGLFLPPTPKTTAQTAATSASSPSILPKSILNPPKLSKGAAKMKLNKRSGKTLFDAPY